MFKVPIDKIIPVTSARARISSLVKKVNENGSMYVLTRGGKPAAILSSIQMFEKTQKELNEQDVNDKVESDQKNTKSLSSKSKKVNDDDTLGDNNDKNDKNVHESGVVDDDIVKPSDLSDNTDSSDNFFADNNSQDEQPVKISIK